MTPEELAEIKRFLPHLPDQIAQEWLAPYVRHEGWPPALDDAGTPVGRWKDLFLGRPLSFWASTHWLRVDRPLGEDDLSELSIQRIAGLLAAYVDGIQNKYADLIPDGPARFQDSLRYVQQHGVIPGAAVILDQPNGYVVADGYHRLAALFYFRDLAAEGVPKVGHPRTVVELPQPLWIGHLTP
jgi:hypothetical protein